MRERGGSAGRSSRGGWVSWIGTLLVACGGNAGDWTVVEAPGAEDAEASPVEPGASQDGAGTSDGGDGSRGDGASVAAEPEPGRAPGEPYCTNTTEVNEIFVQVRTQRDVEALAGCVRVNGSLAIFGDQDLDLTPLSSLRSIESFLEIGVSDTAEEETGVLLKLRSLHGLEGVESVGALTIANVALNLEPLSGLRSVEHLLLHNLPGIVDLQAFGRAHVLRSLSVQSMPDMSSLAGADLEPALWSLSAWDMPRLESLESLDGLESVGVLDLREMPRMTRVAVPDSLVELQTVTLSDMPELTTLSGLSRFTMLEVLESSSNPKLADLGGNGEAGALQRLYVWGCSSLTSIDPVGGLSRVQGVTISDCNAVTELDGLAASSALERLEIFDNDSLVRLPVFERAGPDMVAVRISGNPLLVEGPSFPNLETLHELEAAYAELMIAGNGAMKSIGSFPRLASTGMLDVWVNAQLESVSLPSLQDVTWLRVSHNPRLTRLELDIQRELTVVEVEGNPMLGDVRLGAPATELRRLTLRNNPALPVGVRQQLLDLTVEETELTLD